MIFVSLVFSVVSQNPKALSDAVMTGATDAVTLIISLCGIICMWSGFLEIANRSGLTDKLARLFAIPLKRLFPDVPKDSKAFSYMCMNVSANLLGIGNAATPLGLQAMKELKKMSGSDTATDSMTNFVIMNTASIQLIPTTVAALRQNAGSASPFDTIVCVWITSATALFAGLFVSRLCCRFSHSRHKIRKNRNFGADTHTTGFQIADVRRSALHRTNAQRVLRRK